MHDNEEGAWIFVSHSLKDWNKVRNIRNILEEKGHKPLLFFLKCLNDDSEIDDLIKREIEARNWFILCESENTKKSKWVNAEIEFIKGLEGKVYEIIDLEKDIESQLNKIERLSKRITIFLSYSSSDRQIAQEFKRLFKDNDYRVLDYTQMQAESNFESNITDAIDDALKEGFFLFLISKSSLESNYVMDEIEYAFEKSFSSKKGANIIPISLMDINELMTKMSPLHLFRISKSHIYDFSKGDIDKNILGLIERLKTKEME